MSPPRRSQCIAGAAAMGGAATAYRLGRHLPEPTQLSWQRVNHSGAPVTLLEGPAYAVGVLAGLVSAGAGAGPALATAGAAVFGALDDLGQDTSVKGLRGHLGALRRGEVTTGAVKILGIGATGLAAAWATDRGSRPGVLSTLLGAGVIAGAANVGNLLDLRPGRTLKVGVLAALPLVLSGGTGATAATAASAAALAVLPPDLRRESMLGDTGANAVGAVVGAALTERFGLRGRLAALVTVTALTVLSERVSFSVVIDRTPWLRAVDQWGRR